MNIPLNPCGALAHHDGHTPGQQPGLAALIEWQSVAGAAQAGRFAGGQVQTRPDLDTAGAADLAAGAVRRLAAQELGWQPGRCATWPLALGRLRPWDALPDGVEWIDLTLSVHRSGHWFALPVELVDDDTGDTWLVPDLDGPRPLAALVAAGIDPEAMREAAAREATHCWMLRLDGLGAFVACAIDLGWPG